MMVDAELSPDDAVWQEGDPKPSEPIHVKGRLSPAGLGQFYWHGSIAGDVALECSRCLGPSSAHVTDEAHFIFAEAGTEHVADDPDVFLLDDRGMELDLRPALREEWLLNVPGYALCRDDCKGLCPSCGAELNLGDCGCASSTADPRWADLRTTRDEPG
ncbi:MAG: DUF177 domain-containing protein [Gemmatimonadaceae bacterium]|nr:DUF177 domain-containing protein [Gemmatimonadaceae bacterium]